MKKKIISMLACLLVFASVAYASPYKFIQETYTVQENEDLNDITFKFIVKNTYGDRGFKEFRQGIIEANYDVVKDGLEPGEELVISYWVSDDGQQ